MDLIDIEEFYLQLQDNVTIQNKIVNFSKIDLKHTKSISFNNCKFYRHLTIINSNPIEFIDEIVTFENCSFTSFSFSKCNINLLIIKNSVFENEFSIKDSFFSGVRIESCLNINCEFRILSSIFKDSFWFSDNSFQETGKMVFIKNDFLEQFTLMENTIHRLLFITNNFSNSAVLSYNNLSGFSSFDSCTFKKLDYSNSKIFSTRFNHCNFLNFANFAELERIETSKLYFVSCEFNGLTSFNYSRLNILEIDKSTFDKATSFTNTEFNTIKLSEVKFDKGAYFDEMQLNKIIDKSFLKGSKKEISEWKKTLRTIKYEAQKLENRIDFNQFRNYELAAHYKELSFKNNFIDKTILWATKWSSDFGNWFWSLGFTILSGLIWYTILYRIENTSTFNFDQINNFFVGVFRFFLVTDFYNPLENDRTYLENGWSWLIFIIGKIFIAFGLYEMIQSFRKFKA